MYFKSLSAELTLTTRRLLDRGGAPVTAMVQELLRNLSPLVRRVDFCLDWVRRVLLRQTRVFSHFRKMP
jgi:hypothetical protein